MTNHLDYDQLPDPSESSLLRVAYSCHEGLKILATNFHSQMLVPFGIVAGHCVEALLKCHLMQSGWTHDEVRKLRHDLEAAWRAGAECGPPISGDPPRWVGVLNAGHNKPFMYRYTPHLYGIGTPRAEEVIEPIAPILEALRRKCGYLL
jgi:hypothetical protein